MGHRHADTRPGAWDPQARLADQDLDHLRAEVIYPGMLGLHFFCIRDAEYQREVMRVYNDWLSEFCTTAPDRLLGTAFLPLRGPIAWACEEAERIAKLGLRAVSIPGEVEERPYSHPDYDPLWATLQELGLPVSTHAGTGTGEELLVKFERIGFGVGLVDGKVGMIMRAMADLIWSAVPQRYPKLRFVLAEGGIGWIASVLTYMDH